MTVQEKSRGRFGLSPDTPIWRDERALRALAQIVSAVLLIAAVVWVVTNFFSAADQRGLSLGYEFLEESAEIGRAHV